MKKTKEIIVSRHSLQEHVKKNKLESHAEDESKEKGKRGFDLGGE